MTTATETPLCVVMLTYRRPGALQDAVAALRSHLDDVSGARLLVVDNDSTPSARAAFEASSGGDGRLAYVHEPVPGIAAARNRALDEVGEGLLVFIDDDEQPGPGWLAALVDTWRRYGPAAVVGPVVSRFDTPADAWIAAGAFFTRLRHPTGTTVSTAATNNLLLDLSQVRSIGLRFDERFGLSGGSDTVFTRQMSRAGQRIVWCDEAVVYDVVPPDRATRLWARGRAVRIGNSDSRVAVHLAAPRDRLRVRCVETGRGAVRYLVGGGRMVLGRLTGSMRHEARGTRTMLRGIGMMRGAWGSHLHEYARS